MSTLMPNTGSSHISSILFNNKGKSTMIENEMTQSYEIRKVSPRPSPIEVVSRHEVAGHQSGYQDVLADVSAHPPNTHMGQDHLSVLTG